MEFGMATQETFLRSLAEPEVRRTVPEEGRSAQFHVKKLKHGAQFALPDVCCVVGARYDGAQFSVSCRISSHEAPEPAVGALSVAVVVRDADASGPSTET